MTDRLQELLRQRATIHDHLAWLDREIALARSAEKSRAGDSLKPVAESQAAHLPGPSSTEPPMPDADVLLASYQQDSETLRTDVRKGCLLYFFGALLLLGILIIAFYFVNRLIRQQPTAAPLEQTATPPIQR